MREAGFFEKAGGRTEDTFRLGLANLPHLLVSRIRCNVLTGGGFRPLGGAWR